MFEKYQKLHGKNLLVGCCGSLGLLSLPSYLVQMRTIFNSVNLVTTYSANKILPITTLKHLVDEVYLDDFTSQKIHVQIARENDMMIVIPATANVLASAAHGMGNNLLSTIILAFQQPVIFFPNMNLQMWENRMVKRNVQILKDGGYYVYEPEIRLSYELASQSYRENIVLPRLETILDLVINQFYEDHHPIQTMTHSL